MNNKVGLTLIEVIISIAIIGLLSISMFTIFGTGIINISRAGRRTNTVLMTNDKLDTKIVSPQIIDENGDFIDDNDNSIRIIPVNVILNGFGDDSISITGELIKIVTSTDDGTIVISTFAPVKDIE